ncbi:MAG: BspA family leucine-rich repeat surface protein [Muribaculaceae bacterium]|nr:BspA family leucine-rich repeat surface protein [Muribaculaceae bacterium]
MDKRSLRLILALFLSFCLFGKANSTNYAIVANTGIEHGEIMTDKTESAKGETVNIIVSPEVGYGVSSLTVVAGYEIKGGSTPRVHKNDAMWFLQDSITVTKIDETHYSFILPESFNNDLSPNYFDDTEFHIDASFELRQFSITVDPELSHCSISVEPSTAYINEVINYTAEATSGYSVDEVTITVNGTTSTVSGGSFVMPGGDVVISANVTALLLPYVIYCDDNKTLYFAYTSGIDIGDSWDGHTVTSRYCGDIVIHTGWNVPEWNSLKSDVEYVVFDESFADLKPTSCYAWFYLFDNLSSIDGLEYLDTSSVTITNSMFMACKKLTSLDVNSFDMSKVNNATRMFSTCTDLTTIYCSNTWSITTTDYMFSGCNNLVGAISFDSDKKDGQYANPHTGYFTGKFNISTEVVPNECSITCVSQAYTNETVSFEIVNDGKFELESMTVTANGQEIDVTDNSFIMPPSDVTISAQFIQTKFSLAEALLAENRDELDIIPPLMIGAITENAMYITDKQSAWARVDSNGGYTAQSVRKGMNIEMLKTQGCVANRETAPSFILSTFEWNSQEDPEYSVQTIDLREDFDMPKPSEVVEVIGFYVNGELNGKPDGSGKSMSLKQDFATLSLVESNQYKLLIGIEYKQPWNASQSLIVRDNANQEAYNNLVGQVVEIIEETSIDEIITDVKSSDEHWYSVDGRYLGTNKPNTKGVYICNGNKVIIR